MFLYSDACTILNNDALNMQIKSNSVDLIITSPPYYGIDTKRYGGDFNLQINECKTEDDFVDRLCLATNEMSRVLRPGGSILINISEPSLYKYYCKVIDEGKLIYQNSLIWDLTMDSQKQETLTKTHQTWIHFSKGLKYFINPFYVKKNVGTIIKSNFNNLHTEEEKKLSEYGYVGDAFSLEVVEHFIKMYSKKNDMILDPFAGSGVAAVAALKNNRKAIVNDISEDACMLSVKRLEIYSKYIEAKDNES